jgi:hypothetical protein
MPLTLRLIKTVNRRELCPCSEGRVFNGAILKLIFDLKRMAYKKAGYVNLTNPNSRNIIKISL